MGEPRLLSKGISGKDVLRLQETLNAEGYGIIAEDGIFGPETEGAVIEYQKDNDLLVDGIVGPETSNSLYGEEDDEPPPYSQDNEEPLTEEREKISHEDIIGSAGFTNNLNEAKNSLYHKINVYNKASQDIFSGYEFSYVFITQPELNLFEDYNKISDTLSSEDLKILVQDNMEVARYLDSGTMTTEKYDHKFIYPLMNLLEEMSSTDVDFSVKSSPANKQGISIDYPTNYMESLAGIPLDLSFKIDKYDTVLKIIHIWTMYMTLVQKGIIKPTRADIILQNKFESSCSIYQFVTAEDGETIKFWSKAIGCYPNGIPYSNKSHRRKRDIAEETISIPFYAPFMKAMIPTTLAEFNEIAHQNKNKSIDIPSKRGLPISLRKYNDYFSDTAMIIKENGVYKIRFFDQDSTLT